MVIKTEKSMDQTSGIFIFKQQRIFNSIENIRKLFQDEYNEFKLAYTIKANYYSDLILLLDKQNVLFDCASVHELEILHRAGINTNKASLNTPYLDKSLLKKCLEESVFIYADSFSQLNLINKFALQSNKTLKIGVRLSFSEYFPSRFGIEASDENLKSLLNFFDENRNLELHALNMHYSPSNRSIESFEDRISCFFDVVKKYFETSDLKLLNIGGGFSGPMSKALASQFEYEVPEWEDYSSTLKELVSTYDLKGYKIIIEPGMALVANAFDYVAEVIDIKENASNTYALLNTSTLFLKPTRHSRQLDFEINSQLKDGEAKQYQLVGMSCMESDVLGTYKGNLSIGTKIIFRNVGAYTLSFRENFIFDQPPVINEK